MKKTLFIVLAVMFAFSASAQKVKIKKGEIQLDGVSVVKIEKPKGSDAFVFRDLSGNQLFTVSEETKAPSGFPFLNSVLLFTGTNGNMQEISTKDIKYPFVFGKEYNMAYLVINSGADLITAQGVNMDKVNEFFKTSNRSVSEAFIAEIELAEAELAKEDELANSVELTVKRDGNIMANGKKIGRISVTRSESGSSCSYRISEYNDIFIASMDAKMTTDPEFYETKTYDGKVFSVYSGKGFSFLLDSNDTAKRLVRKLYYQGYKLGNLKEFFEEKKRAEEEALKAKKEASIEASGNIYNKQGYIIDKKGKKIEGLITLEFVPRFEAEGKRDATAEELRGYGNRVTIRTGEDKFVELPDGTKSVYEKNEFTYKANEDVRVVVDDVQYLSVTGSIGGRESYFYEIIYEKDENMVLQEHKYGTVLLKLANQKKPEELGYTALFGTKKPEKIKKEFDEYVNCPALTYSDYATNTVEGLIELVNDYVEKCK